MPAPSFLATGFAYDSVDADDVQAAIDLFEDVVLNQLDPTDQWTEVGTGSGYYETPELEPNGAARKFSVQLTRDSQTVLEVLVRDQNGITLHDGEIHLSGNTEIKVFAGPCHFVIQFLYGGSTYEYAIATMADPRPLPLSAYDVYVTTKIRRDNAGNPNPAEIDNWVVNDAAGLTHVNRLPLMYNPNATPDGRTSGGSMFHLHCDIVSQISGSTFATLGKLMQFVLISQAHPAGAVVEIPISDDGGVGEFEVLGVPPSGSGGFSGKLAVRRSF